MSQNYEHLYKHMVNMDRFCLEIRPFGNYCPHSCNFCYQKKGKKACSTMSLNTSIKALKCTLDYMSLHSLKELKLVFHGGEPAHDGGSLIFEIVDNARKIFDKKTDIIIHCLCHTSGFSKIDIDGFSQRNIMVCVNKHVPNKMTEHFSMNFKHNIESLFDRGILIKQIIVLSKETLRHVDECLDAINEFGLPTKLQPQFPSSPDVCNEEDYPNIENLLDFIVALLRGATSRKINLHNVEFLNRIITYHCEENLMVGCRLSEECAFSSENVKSIAVDVDGTFYACNRFAGIRTFPLSNINASRESIFCDIEYTMRNIKRQYGFRTQAAKERCTACAIGMDKACTGTSGCPFFSYIWNTGNVDPYCWLDELLYIAF